MTLVEYFEGDSVRCSLGESVGMEVETQFFDSDGRPITKEKSQNILREFVSKHEWQVISTKSNFIAEIQSKSGDRLLYELGRHNIELGTIPLAEHRLLAHAHEQLELLYKIAAHHDAVPFFEPVFETDEDLLVIPDERDAIWLELDGRRALNLLTRCSAVQFTIDVDPRVAIRCLNLLGVSLEKFLTDYPQDKLWRQYIGESKAGYDPLRYGGPLFFRDLEDYCTKLLRHKVVYGTNLVSFSEVKDLNISLFLRSIWWYFRLKRYGRKLCIEIRPLARRSDNSFEAQLQFVMGILRHI